MADSLFAWQCIGCGKIEAPQQCVGVCEHRKVEMVSAHAYRAEVAALQARLAAAESVLRQIAHTTPRQGEAEHSWLAIRKRARAALIVDAPPA
mgnify:CR=1 FL=1